MIKRDRHRVVQANNNIVIFKQSFLESYVNQHKTLNASDTIKTKKELARLCICALASTGIRTEELFSTNYTFVKDEETGVLHQSNVAKNRGDARPLFKPLVCGMSADEWISIRQTILTSGKTKRELQSVIGSVIVSDFQKDFLDTKTMTAHKFRNIYAVMSQDLASKGMFGSTWKDRAVASTIIGWCKYVLGHSDLCSSLPYITFRSDTNKEHIIELEKAQSLVPQYKDDEDDEAADIEAADIEAADIEAAEDEVIVSLKREREQDGDVVIIDDRVKRQRRDDDNDLEYETFKRELAKIGISPSGHRLTDMKKYMSLLEFKLQNQ